MSSGWVPGDYLYDEFFASLSFTAQPLFKFVLDYYDEEPDGGAMDWAPNMNYKWCEYDLPRAAEPGPWTWLQPARVLEGVR